ncbi:MAG: MqnA/MqnD/SBP family protein, partial [Planctomycetota bacterium]
SVALLRVLLHDLYGLTPKLVHYDARQHLAEGRPIDPARPPEAMLLIGDKVVTDAPSATVYPYQLDLGGGWHDLYRRPFVFAVWMKRAGTDLGDLPAKLVSRLDRNLGQLNHVVQTYAADHGWPLDLATDYLGHILRYRLGNAELGAVDFFRQRLAELDLLGLPRSPDPAALTRDGI